MQALKLGCRENLTRYGHGSIALAIRIQLRRYIEIPFAKIKARKSEICLLARNRRNIGSTIELHKSSSYN